MEELGIVLLIILGIVGVIGGIALYFLPAIIAYKRGHANKGIILLIDFLLGWTFLGWAGCLVWAFIDTDGTATKNVFRNVGRKQIRRYSKIAEAKGTRCNNGSGI